MLLSEALQYFLDARAGLAEKTLRINRQYLFPFLHYFGDREVASFTLAELRYWRKYLIERQTKYGGKGRRKETAGSLSLHTVHGYLRVLKQFFRWLLNESLIQSNPAARLEQVNLNLQVPQQRMMSQETFDKLRAVAQGNSPERIRDRALLWLFRQSGARLGGIAHMLVGDLDLQRRRAEVLEKGAGGGVRRLIYFNAEAQSALREWLEMRAVLPLHCENLFITVPNGAGMGGGNPLREGSIYAAFYRMAKRARVKLRFNPHSQRHALAKRMLDNGANLAAVSIVMGHGRGRGSVRVTGDFYGRYENSEAEAIHNRFCEEQKNAPRITQDSQRAE